ncbi:MAG: heme utilization cystosolic carrier protein HutX [Oxalobacter sp.]|nr:heme utilization cystosolic carrier protein HutX [Oxalobacter sp.]
MQQKAQEDISAIKESIRQTLAKNPGTQLEPLARENGLPTSDVIELLPEGTWQKTSGECFVDIMKALSKLGKMTTIINTGDVIFEYVGEVSNGGVAHGFYNLTPKSPLHGHIRHGNCKAIYLVERLFMNLPTLSIQFANQEGKIMFKVYAGRDENRQLLADQVDAMKALFKNTTEKAIA